MKSTFVERHFDLEPGGKVVATIFAPKEHDGYYRCDYTIDWPDRQDHFYGAGEDAVQALLHALMHVEVRLTTSPEFKEGKLTWLGANCLGLPSTDAFRTAPPAAV
jgi:hypothetical protein